MKDSSHDTGSTQAIKTIKGYNPVARNPAYAQAETRYNGAHVVDRSKTTKRNKKTSAQKVAGYLDVPKPLQDVISNYETGDIINEKVNTKYIDEERKKKKLENAVSCHRMILHFRLSRTLSSFFFCSSLPPLWKSNPQKRGEKERDVKSLFMLGVTSIFRGTNDNQYIGKKERKRQHVAKTARRALEKLAKFSVSSKLKEIEHLDGGVPV